MMADFIQKPEVNCSDLCIELEDKSTLLATNWLWSMPGGTPSSSTSRNPNVCYDSAGIYPVTLIASGPAGSDTITRMVRTALLSGPIVLTQKTEVSSKSGEEVIMPIRYTLPSGFGGHWGMYPPYTAHFERMEIGLSYSDKYLLLPLSNLSHCVVPDTGWMVQSVDTGAGLLRLILIDTGYRPLNSLLLFNIPDSTLHIGTLRFTASSKKSVTATVKLAYAHLETTEESFGFCDALENSAIATIRIEGSNAVDEGPSAATHWRANPNPVEKGELLVHPPASFLGSKVVLTLVDLLGRERVHLEPTLGSNPISISTAGLPEGTFYLRIVAGGSIQTEKIEVRR